MKDSERDLSILRHILSYCTQIDEAVERFGEDGELFVRDAVYHNAVSLCILQIGELVGNLSEGFRASHPGIPWREIKLMRNIVAHRYGTVDHSITWEVVENDIPALKEYCCRIIRETDRQESGCN